MRWVSKARITRAGRDSARSGVGEPDWSSREPASSGSGMVGRVIASSSPAPGGGRRRPR